MDIFSSDNLYPYELKFKKEIYFCKWTTKWNVDWLKEIFHVSLEKEKSECRVLSVITKDSPKIHSPREDVICQTNLPLGFILNSSWRQIEKIAYSRKYPGPSQILENVQQQPSRLQTTKKKISLYTPLKSKIIYFIVGVGNRSYLSCPRFKQILVKVISYKYSSGQCQFLKYNIFIIYENGKP